MKKRPGLALLKKPEITLNGRRKYRVSAIHEASLISILLLLKLTNYEGGPTKGFSHSFKDKR